MVLTEPLGRGIRNNSPALPFQIQTDLLSSGVFRALVILMARSATIVCECPTRRLRLLRKWGTRFYATGQVAIVIAGVGIEVDAVIAIRLLRISNSNRSCVAVNALESFDEG